MRYLILFLLSRGVSAGFIEVSNDELYQYQNRPDSQKRQKQVAAPKREFKVDRELLQKIAKQDEQIQSILEAQSRSLIIKKVSTGIKALSRLKGILLNSLMAMNVGQSTALVRLNDGDGEFEGAEIRCHVMSFQKRIRGNCDLFVIDGRAYPIDARLWDIDGAHGLRADEYYSGEEKEFLTRSVSLFLESMLEGAKSKITTPFGEVTNATSKNQLMNGLMAVARNGHRKISDSADSKVEISLVHSGREVIIYFNSEVEFKKGNL